MSAISNMRSVLLTGLSFVCTAAVIANGYYQKQQFYPSVVYITKSNASMAVLYLQALVLVILMGKFMRKIFFGQLRAAEMEHLIERSWYAVTETCLAFTVFRDDFSPRFVASFTLLLFLKSFHWLAEDRVDYMERSPLISCIFHTRVVCLLVFLGSLDAFFVDRAYFSTIMKGASVELVFGFEYAILLTIVFMTFTKYVMHTIDLQNENPWENKAVYLLYTELIIGFIKVVLYVSFMTIMIKVHTFPLFAIRPMYITLRTFKKALHDVVMSRRAIRNMNTLYRDATPEEIQAGDSICIICREEMTTGCKKLPCNHIYHTSCLRSWFQRQQTCPTCRMDVLRVPRPAATPTPAPQPPQQQNPAAPPMPPFNMMPPYPMWPPGGFPPQQQQQQATSTATTAQSTTATASMPPLPPMMSMPPFYMPQMPCEFPRPPPDLSQMSSDDLLAMEGHERRNVEMRIRWLRDIQVLLDSAMMLINQYNDVAGSLNISSVATTSLYPSVGTSIPTTADSTTVSTGTGARPKSSTIPLHMQVNDAQNTTDDVEGASGYTAPVDELMPDWSDSQTDDNMHEIRRRRVERFSLTGIDSTGDTSRSDKTGDGQSDV